MAIFYGTQNLIPAEAAGFAGININNIRYPQPIADPRLFKPTYTGSTIFSYPWGGGFGNAGSIANVETGQYAFRAQHTYIGGNINAYRTVMYSPYTWTQGYLENNTSYTLDLVNIDTVNNDTDADNYPYGGALQWIGINFQNERDQANVDFDNFKINLTIDGVTYIYDLDGFQSNYDTNSDTVDTKSYVIGWPFYYSSGSGSGGNSSGRYAFATATPPGIPAPNPGGGGYMANITPETWMTLGLPWLRWERDIQIQLTWDYDQAFNPYSMTFAGRAQIFRFPTTGVPTDNTDNEDQRTIYTE